MKIPYRTIPVLLLCLAAGCKSAEEKRAAKEAKRAEQEAAMKAVMHENVPAESPLQKVTLGMTETEVQEVLGPPTQTSTRITGKQFNPFHFSGRDTMRVVYHYRGIGRVEFSHGSWGQRHGAIQCVHAPEEP